MAELEQVFGVPVIEAYGMTEAAHQIASNPLPPGTRKPGTVGPAGRCEVGVLDDDGSVLPPGSVGEIGDPRTERHVADISTIPTPTPPPSSTGGSAPATRAASTTTAT